MRIMKTNKKMIFEFITPKNLINHISHKFFKFHVIFGVNGGGGGLLER